jgi:hypothetical protein
MKDINVGLIALFYKCTGHVDLLVWQQKMQQRQNQHEQYTRKSA